MRKLAFIFLALLLWASPSLAATRTISAVGGNWNTAATWDEVAVPTAADAVVARGDGLSGNLTIDGVSGTPSLARSVDFTNYTGTLTHASGKELDVGDGTTGAFKLVAGMAYAPSTGSLIIFKSTTTGNNITTAGKSLGPITFNGSGGAWTLVDAFTSARDLTMTLGSVTANSTVSLRALIANGGTLTLGGNVTLTAGLTVAGGTVTGGAYTIGGATSCTLSSGSLTILGITASGGCTTSGATVAIGATGLNGTSETISSGTVTMTGPTVLTGALSISSTGSLNSTGQNISGGTSLSMTSSGTFNVANFTGTTTCSMTAGTSTITGNVACTTLTMSGSTLRSISLGNGTYTLSGTGTVVSFGTTPTNLTFIPGNSLIKITDTSATTKNITGGAQTFYDMQVSGAASAGTFTINQSNTFHTLTFDPDSNIKITSGTTQTVTSLSAAGTSGHTIALSAVTAATPATISQASGTVSTCDYIVMQDMTSTGGAAFYAGANSTNTSGNTGWVFATKPTSGQHFASSM